jgi:hypothetical protein
MINKGFQFIIGGYIIESKKSQVDKFFRTFEDISQKSPKAEEGFFFP